MQSGPQCLYLRWILQWWFEHFCLHGEDSFRQSCLVLTCLQPVRAGWSHRLVSSQAGSFKLFRTFLTSFSRSLRALCSSSRDFFIFLLSCELSRPQDGHWPWYWTEPLPKLSVWQHLWAGRWGGIGLQDCEISRGTMALWWQTSFLRARRTHRWRAHPNKISAKSERRTTPTQFLVSIFNSLVKPNKDQKQQTLNNLRSESTVL